MAIHIVWPEKRMVPNALIDKWFVDAVAKGEIHPRYLGATTAVFKAEALQECGRIRLAGK